MRNIMYILIVLTVVFFSCTKKNNVESTGEVSISNEKIETVNENNSPNVDVYYMSIYENDTVDSWCGDLDIGDKVEFIRVEGFNPPPFMAVKRY